MRYISSEKDIGWLRMSYHQIKDQLPADSGQSYCDGKHCNENTDGAISLMVLGNLEAEHLAVGGQEVYVAGNAKIQG